MGKNKTKKTNTKDLRGQHKKIERQYNSGSFSLSSIIKVVLVILLVLLIFYFLTVGILKISGDMNALQYLYQSGAGSHHATGFGSLNVIRQGGKMNER